MRLIIFTIITLTVATLVLFFILTLKVELLIISFPLIYLMGLIQGGEK